MLLKSAMFCNAKNRWYPGTCILQLEIKLLILNAWTKVWPRVVCSPPDYSKTKSYSKACGCAVVSRLLRIERSSFEPRGPFLVAKSHNLWLQSCVLHLFLIETEVPFRTRSLWRIRLSVFKYRLSKTRFTDLGPVSRKPRKLFGLVKPLQNLEPCDYRAVLFTHSKDQVRLPSYKKFQAYTVLRL